MNGLDIVPKISNDWEIIDKSIFDENSKESQSTDIILSIDSVDITVGKSSEDIEELYDDNQDYEEENDIENETKTELQVIPPSKLGLKMSFKDAILSNKRPSISQINSNDNAQRNYKKRSTTTEWKPKIQVEKVSNTRSDRLCGPQPSYFDIDDEDDNGYWDLVNSQLNNKSSAAATRYRGITMLTPSQQAKKDTRIIEKLVR